MKTNLIITLALLMAAAGTACAQATGFYAGTGLGPARTDLDTGRINAELTSLGFSNVGTNTDRTDTAYKIFGGFRLLPNLAIELGYSHLGESEFSSDVTTLTRTGQLRVSLKTQLVSVDVVPTFEIMPRLSLLGRVGYVRAETKGELSSSGAVQLIRTGETKRRNTYKLGLGAQYDFTPRLGARVEWERYFNLGSDDLGGKYDADVFGVSALFRF